MGDRTRTCRVLVEGNTKEREHLEDVVVDGRFILKLIFKKYDGRA
jgi:hypothetical protein